MAANNNSPVLMSYPASLGSDVAQGQHYMIIDSYESSSAVDKEGSGTRRSSIALYIPPGSLQTTIGQNYNALEGGTTKAALAGKGGIGVGSFLSEAAQSVLAKPKIVADFQTAAFGLAKNNHMALVYRGPADFRTHTFNFSFWPKTKDETKEVSNIIKDFKMGSTPRMAGLDKKSTKLMAPYFSAPRQWEIKFCKGASGISQDTGQHSAGENPYLFKIGRSVITTMTINHDPDTLVGFHDDGAPVHSTLAITFQELEYVISEDPVSEQLETNMKEAEEQKRKIKDLEKKAKSGHPVQQSQARQQLKRIKE